ncbi:MAG: Crp/Fnr family transcriptional regulator [Syntrophobacterales bacterium]|nr:Crp/Fnr family transcriptional regulator [Syntrophobacterales bacterium]
MSSSVRDLIESIPIFSALDPESKDELAQFCILKHYEKGSLIFREGTVAKGFFAVISGLVKIFKTSWEGKEQVLHIFGPSEIFAEVPVFHGITYPASAEALMDTKLLFFPKDEFLQFVRTHGDAAIKLLAVLSERLRMFTRLIEDLSLKEVPARLASYILYRQSQEKGSNLIALDIPKNLLAGLLGTTPESISRTFTKMKQSGCIDILGRDIAIKDVEFLRKLALEGKWGEE